MFCHVEMIHNYGHNYPTEGATYFMCRVSRVLRDQRVPLNPRRQFERSLNNVKSST